MNKTISQKGNIVNQVGQRGSYADIKERYDITMPEVLELDARVFMQGCTLSDNEIFEVIERHGLMDGDTKMKVFGACLFYIADERMKMINYANNRQ